MQIKSFSKWLRHISGYDKNEVNKIVSNCKDIEKQYGDLDENYINDKLSKITEELPTDEENLALKTYLKFKENSVLDKIMNNPDIDPDKHDGSYELVRETINSLSKLNLNKIGIEDLDMLYAMSLGTWKMGISIRIDRINNSNLPDEEKKRLKSVLNKLVKNAKDQAYSNMEEGQWSIGMFGTGFYSFNGKSSIEDAKSFISLLVKIKDLDDDEETFAILEEGFKNGISGIQSGSASMMLHCLKPKTFPIINGATIISIIVLEGMGVVLDRGDQLKNYIDNTRILKKFRDENCKFKNYRVLDMVLWNVGELKVVDKPIRIIAPGVEPVKITPPDLQIKLPTKIDFSRDLNFKNLYFSNEEILKTQISIALKSGKSIILIGPPGTGKSKLAKMIAESYEVDSKMVTAMSDWSSYDTIGGYKPNADGSLYFEEGIFLSSFKSKEGQDINKWLIIDEINRADIDKSFGPFLSVLSSDDIVLGLKDDRNKNIEILLEKNLDRPVDEMKIGTNQYIVPEDWRIIGTMNTFDKTSLYEMSYAFMRRFAFIPVAIPNNIDGELVKSFLHLWDMDLETDKCENISSLWKVINKYRKVGPAIIEDIGNFIIHGGDYTSAIVIYILPQFEGLFTDEITSFINEVKTFDFIEDMKRLIGSIEDFFNISIVGE